MERPIVEIIKGKHNGKWIITVRGVTSGAELDFHDEDNGSISFAFDASRFEPTIRVDQ